jgi:hypothetical protein
MKQQIMIITSFQDLLTQINEMKSYAYRLISLEVCCNLRVSDIIRCKHHLDVKDREPPRSSSGMRSCHYH